MKTIKSICGSLSSNKSNLIISSTNKLVESRCLQFVYLGSFVILYCVTIKKMKKLLSCNSKKEKDVQEKEKTPLPDDFDQKFGNYKCKYCHYVSAQKWILERHVSSVHFRVCILHKLCICRKCYSTDSPKDPYQCRAFKNWH